MKPKKREENERCIKNALREILGRHLIGVEFWYQRGSKKIFVTYKDFKPHIEIEPIIRKVSREKWSIILRRVYSNKLIKDTLFDVYNKNHVAIVDMVNGELKPYTIRDYIHNLIMKE